jgi:hypothetical protein
MMQELTRKERIAYWVGVHLVTLGCFLACCVAAGVM